MHENDLRKGTHVRRDAAERYNWEKRRALRPVSERRATGATEHDTGLTKQDLAFYTEYTTVDADADLASVFDVPNGTKLLVRSYRTRQADRDVPIALCFSYLVYSIDVVDRVVEVSDIRMAGDRAQLVYTTPLDRWPAQSGQPAE